MIGSFLNEIDNLVQSVTGSELDSYIPEELREKFSDVRTKITFVQSILTRMQEASETERTDVLFEAMKKSWLQVAPAVERVSILLYDLNQDALFDSRDFKGELSCPPGTSKHPTSFSISGLVFQTKKAVYVPDTAQSNIIPQWIAQELKIRCSFGVPFLYKGFVVGVVRFDSLSRPNAFDNFLRTVLEYSVWHMGVLFQQTALPNETKEFLRRLEVSEQKNRALISALPDTYFVVDRDGTYLDFYAKDENKFAVPPSQFMGQKMKDVLGADETEGFYNVLNEVFITGKTQTYEYEYPFDEELKFFSTRLIPFDEYRCLVIDREITEERKVLERLKESEERFRSFYEAAPGGIMILDKEGKILQNNLSMDTMLEYSRHELTGRYIYELSPPDEVKINFPFFYAVALKDKPFYEFEHRLRTKNNVIITVLVRLSVLIEDDENTQIIGHFSNISGLKQALVEKEHRERFLQIISGLSLHLLTSPNIKDAVKTSIDNITLVAEADAGFLYRYNEQTKQFQCYASASLKKGNCENEKEERIKQRESLLNKRIKIFTDGEIFRASRRNAIRDIYFYMKTTQVSSIIVVPVFIQNKLWGVIGFEEEHSLRNWIESEISLIQAAAGIIGASVSMFEAQNSALKQLRRSRFLSDLMLHDITNHNNAVFPVLEMITEGYETGTDEHKMLLTAYEESKDISRLITNIRTFDDLTPGKLEISDKFPVLTILKSSVTEAENSIHLKPLTITFEDTSGGVNPPGNKLLKIVFDDIIRNSIKYSEQNHILIEINYGYNADKDAVIILISDNSRGIRESERKKVFSRFTEREETLQSSRTGFSLTLCSRIIEKLDGTITIDERVKGNFSLGSVVKITIPAGLQTV